MLFIFLLYFFCPVPFFDETIGNKVVHCSVVPISLLYDIIYCCDDQHSELMVNTEIIIDGQLKTTILFTFPCFAKIQIPPNFSVFSSRNPQ